MFSRMFWYWAARSKRMDSRVRQDLQLEQDLNLNCSKGWPAPSLWNQGDSRNMSFPNNYRGVHSRERLLVRGSTVRTLAVAMALQLSQQGDHPAPRATNPLVPLAAPERKQVRCKGTVDKLGLSDNPLGCVELRQRGRQSDILLFPGFVPHVC